MKFSWKNLVKVISLSVVCSVVLTSLIITAGLPYPVLIVASVCLGTFLGIWTAAVWPVYGPE